MSPQPLTTITGICTRILPCLKSLLMVGNMTGIIQEVKTRKISILTRVHGNISATLLWAPKENRARLNIQGKLKVTTTMITPALRRSSPLWFLTTVALTVIISRRIASSTLVILAKNKRLNILKSTYMEIRIIIWIPAQRSMLLWSAAQIHPILLTIIPKTLLR